MRWLLFFASCLSVSFVFATERESLEAEISIRQAEWREGEGSLFFDVEISAKGRPFYLSFSEIVLQLPGAVYRDSTAFSLEQHTGQLFTLGGDRISYASGIQTVTTQRGRQTYFIIRILPNQFLDPMEFFDEVALIDSLQGFHRLGRFVIRGIRKPGRQLLVKADQHSPSSSMRAFDPLLDFKAVEVGLVTKPLRFRTSHIWAMEAGSSATSLILTWKVGKELELLPWKLFVSTDRENWQEALSGTGGRNLELLHDRLPVAFRRKPVYVRVVWYGKRIAYRGPVFFYISG